MLILLTEEFVLKLKFCINIVFPQIIIPIIFHDIMPFLCHTLISIYVISFSCLIVWGVMSLCQRWVRKDMSCEFNDIDDGRKMLMKNKEAKYYSQVINEINAVYNYELKGLQSGDEQKCGEILKRLHIRERYLKYVANSFNVVMPIADAVMIAMIIPSLSFDEFSSLNNVDLLNSIARIIIPVLFVCCIHSWIESHENNSLSQFLCEYELSVMKNNIKFNSDGKL